MISGQQCKAHLGIDFGKDALAAKPNTVASRADLAAA
jgi:hypothetical protein